MIRSFFTLLLVTLLALLPGCAKYQSETGGKKKLKIGVSIPAADHGWTAGVGWWAKQTMTAHPDIEWVYATANSADKQVADIEDMLAQHIDGLVVIAMDSASLTDVCVKAHERGVYIVNVDRGLLKPVADVFLEGDNQAFGKSAADFICEKLGGKGKVVLLRGIPCTVDADRYEAAMEVFNAHPGIEVLAAQPGLWNRTKALEVMQSYLSQFPRIDAVWAADDDMALGVEQAIREAGRENEMFIFPGAGMKEIVKKVMERDPMYPADNTYPPGMIAAGIELAAAHLRDGDLAKAADRIPRHLFVTADQLKPDAGGRLHVKIGVRLITPDNAKDFYFPDSVY